VHPQPCFLNPSDRSGKESFVCEDLAKLIAVFGLTQFFDGFIPLVVEELGSSCLPYTDGIMATGQIEGIIG
jgi:hypothetical protein